MEITDALEGWARGVHSGAPSHFSAVGAADLSIVIQTAVAADGTQVVGSAIVVDSDAKSEYQEFLLKARSALRELYPGTILQHSTTIRQMFDTLRWRTRLLCSAASVPAW